MITFRKDSHYFPGGLPYELRPGIPRGSRAWAVWWAQVPEPFECENEDGVQRYDSGYVTLRQGTNEPWGLSNEEFESVWTRRRHLHAGERAPSMGYGHRSSLDQDVYLPPGSRRLYFRCEQPGCTHGPDGHQVGGFSDDPDDLHPICLGTCGLPLATNERPWPRR